MAMGQINKGTLETKKQSTLLLTETTWTEYELERESESNGYRANFGQRR